MPKSPQTQINELVRLLNDANRKYRNGEPSPLTDTEFDSKLNELRELERQYPEYVSAESPTRIIGDVPKSGFVRVKHTHPMLSIANVYTEGDLRKWLKKIDSKYRNVRFVIEHKVDGCGLAFRYKKGRLVQAITRGDGEYGDDVTANAMTIRDIPHRLDCKIDLEIRGEVYMRNDEFQEWNKKSPKKYANSRNAVAGSIRLLDAKECAKRPLRFLAHSMANNDTLVVQKSRRGDYGDLGCIGHYTSQSEFISFVYYIGFKTPRLTHESDSNAPLTSKQVMEYVGPDMRLERGDFTPVGFECDGLVIKVNDFEIRRKLGETATEPRWEIALKTEKYEGISILNSVVWQVGKTGTLTPVAEFDEIPIAGTRVSRATLHNVDEIARLDIAVGDKIKVIKAGKIIPKVESVEERPEDRIPIHPPKECPECRWELYVGIPPTGEATIVRCPNPDCPSQITGRLISFCSRDGVDISSFGEVAIENLTAQRILHDPADIYSLTKEQLETVYPGPKMPTKILKAIAEKKSPDLQKFLYGLSIFMVGEGTSKRLAKHFKDLNTIAAAKLHDLMAVADIGELTARYIYEYFHSDYWKTLSAKLKKQGVYPESLKEERSGSQALAGQTIVVTGTLERYGRKEIEALIEKHGGKASSGVSKKTSFVVAGKEAGSKLTKAEELGIPVITEEEFEAKIQNF
jgi:DNA ligase (NAD+)